MIRFTAAYPYRSDARFDFDYYATRHRRVFEEAYREAGIERVTVERGVRGLEPGSDPAYLATWSATFRDEAKFLELFRTNGPRVAEDVSNFTDVEPIVQIGEIVLQA